jgi:hypothetical protein
MAKDRTFGDRLKSNSVIRSVRNTGTKSFSSEEDLKSIPSKNRDEVFSDSL